MANNQGINVSQLRHALSMSRKIKTQLDSMLSSMNAISYISPNDMKYVPVQSVIQKFEELETYCLRIQSIISDMLPSLQKDNNETD